MGRRSSRQISLDLMATVLGDLVELVLGFDVFGDCYYAQTVAERGDFHCDIAKTRIVSIKYEEEVNNLCDN